MLKSKITSAGDDRNGPRPVAARSPSAEPGRAAAPPSERPKDELPTLTLRAQDLGHSLARIPVDAPPVPGGAGVVQLAPVDVFLTTPMKSNQLVQAEDETTGAAVWQLVRKACPKLAPKIRSSIFTLKANGSLVYDSAEQALTLVKDSSLVLQPKGGSQQKLEEKRGEEPFSTWTPKMEAALKGEITLMNGPNGERSKVYSQQEYDQILEALDQGTSLQLTFIDPNFEKAAEAGLLVHQVLSQDWDVDWSVDSSDGSIRAKSGDVTINYIPVYLSEMEMQVLQTKYGARMFGSKPSTYEPTNLIPRSG